MITRVSLVALLSVFSVQAVDASSFGRTAGNFNVSAMGSAQYSIPIWTPPGPRGIQPHLALAYDSNNGVGPLGIGWGIAGLGAISRCNKTYAQDGAAAAVALATSDGYCFNGNRLRLTSGTYGTATSTYQTEIADFSNITANGTQGNGPSYFTVQGKDGLTYQYGYVDANGNGVNSQVLAAGTATTWFLSKVIDRTGNNLVINYIAPNGTTLVGTTVPDTILWTPTSAGASTYSYSLKFNYTSNLPPSSLAKYVAGTSVVNKELLSSIAISYVGTVIKDYFLGYQSSAVTGRYELNSIKECADSAQTNCLLPTSVTYQDGIAGISTTALTATTSSTPVGLLARYDLNGDGIPDLIYSNGGITYVAFGSATGFQAPFNSGIPGFLLAGNVDGTSKDGVLTVVSGTWWYYKWNGSAFTGTSTGLAYDSTQQKYQLADVNGDGLPDLISWAEVLDTGKFDVTIYSRLNTSSSGTVSFSTTLNTAWGPDFRTDGALLQTPDMQPGKIRRFDFNGDGSDDLVFMIITGNSPSFTMTTYAMVSNGSGGFNAFPITSSSGAAYTPIQLVNLNDDGCTDFVDGTVLFIAACNGSPATSVNVGTVVGAMDWNGDGRTDLVVANGSTLGVYLSTGQGVSSLVSTSVPYSSSCQYVTTDANGDGMDDLACWSQAGSNPITYYLHNGPKPDLAVDFFDGYVVKYTPAYVALSQATSANYTKGTSQVYPQQDYDGPLYVTQYALIPNGIGTTYTVHYDYTGAVMNLQGRGFQGFSTINALSDQVHFNDTKTYSTGTLSGGIVIPTAGMLLSETLITTGGTNVTNSQNTLGILTLDATANNQRYFPYTASSTANTYEIQPGGSYNGKLITTTATNYNTPDVYGNFADVVTTVTDEDSGSPYFGQQWTTTTATTITASPSTWCNNLPTERDVTNTAPGVPAITRHLGFTPDYSFCRETQQVVESGNATYQVTTGYGFDAFGNINSQTVTGIGMAPRTTGINWGTTGQFPTTITNALSQTAHTNFDPISGNPLSVQDPNGIGTSWLYDAFERKQQETRPDGTSTTWAYNNCAIAGCVNTNNKMTVVQTNVNVGGTILSTENTYVDTFDRTLVTSKQMLNGAYDRNEVQYNGLGTVQQQSAPCTFVSCVYYWTTYSYDNLKRLTQSQRPISATNSTLQTTTVQYSGRTTTTTDPQGKVTTNITQVTGNVGRTMDNNGYYVNFNHDAFGSVLSVTDKLANTLRTMTYAYGLKAFRTSLADMDLGTRSYTHDALGEVTAYSDGKGQNFSAIFDALSRMTSHTEPAPTGTFTSTWTWGTTAASHNIGKLASVQSVATGGTYIESYTYDSVGRLSNETITLPTDGTPAFDYAYDATTGLLSTLTYPPSWPNIRLVAGYTYQHGILQQIFDATAPTTIWWQANAMNPRGQITQETTEDLAGHPQIVSNRTFDAVTGWLGSTQTGPGGGATLQNEAYQYDEMGNVIQRQNNNLGLTENFYYDNLYRLDHSILGASTNLQMAYDAMGNITSRSDLAGGAIWTYDPVRKHAVTQAGSSSFTYAYDANGNVTSRNGSLISWTSYNYPSGVGTATESATFDYGPNHQRWRMVYTGPSFNETTFYATPKFEKVYVGGGGEYRSYIYAGNRPVVVVMRNTASQIKVRSLLVDHQGSISSIVTDSTGVTLVGESFTAYGNPREASTWSGPPTSGELTTMNGVTREGYTFQTVLGSMGLNHMNGRIEDSVTGRFLSPDPHGTIPGSTQSWNRYSYVNNNPLTLTDPTGFAVVPYCHDWCPGKNWHPAPYAFSSWGNNSSSLEGMVGTTGWFPVDMPTGGSSLSTTTGDEGGNPEAGGDAAFTGELSTASLLAAFKNAPLPSDYGGDGVKESADQFSDQVSDWASVVGGAALVGDMSSGTASIGTNWSLYSAPRGNQYFSTLVELGTVFKVVGGATLFLGTAADYYSASHGGRTSYGQANLNLGVGVVGLTNPMSGLGGFEYFVISHLYPGGPPEYNKAYSDAASNAQGWP